MEKIFTENDVLKECEKQGVHYTELKSITIPEDITTIGEYAFRACKSLKSIVIPASVTTIGEGAFAWCKSLENIVIPDSVTTIGNYVFYCCYSLKSIVIPDSVTTIGEDAFSCCDNLKSIKVSKDFDLSIIPEDFRSKVVVDDKLNIETSNLVGNKESFYVTDMKSSDSYKTKEHEKLKLKYKILKLKYKMLKLKEKN